MKKVFLLSFVAGILCGCAAGINHNVAQINGQNYLIETKINNFLGLSQWSSPSTLTPLEAQNATMPKNYTPSTARAELAKIADECNIQSIKAQSRPNYKKMYKCIVDKLDELEQNAN